MIPAAVITLIVVTLFVNLVFPIMVSFHMDTDGAIFRTMNDCISTGTSTGAFVFVGTLIAPSYQKIVALSLTALSCLLMGYGWHSGMPISGESYSFFVVFAGITGSIIGYLTICDRIPTEQGPSHQ